MGRRACEKRREKNSKKGGKRGRGREGEGGKEREGTKVISARLICFGR